MPLLKDVHKKLVEVFIFLERVTSSSQLSIYGIHSHVYDESSQRSWVNKQQKQKQFVPRIFFDDTLLERSCQEIILIMNCQPSSCANFSAIVGSDIS